MVNQLKHLIRLKVKGKSTSTGNPMCQPKLLVTLWSLVITINSPRGKMINHN